MELVLQFLPAFWFGFFFSLVFVFNVKLFFLAPLIPLDKSWAARDADCQIWCRC